MKLIHFLKKISGETISVDTKQNTTVTGTVTGIDMQMNIHLKKVKVLVKDREPQPMDHLTLRGNSIRSITLPDALPLDTLLTESATSGGGRKKTAKGKGKGKGIPVKKR